MTAVLDKAEIAATLNKAADVIEERGHCHGRLEDSQGRLCLFGAIRVAMTGTADDTDPRMGSVIRPLEVEVDDWPPAWNDELSGGKFKHNKREAVRLLRRVARKVAGQ